LQYTTNKHENVQARAYFCLLCGIDGEKMAPADAKKENYSLQG